MLDTTRPFCLYALAEIIYDGRAYSTLELGNYLIVHKYDGSIQIHGSNKIPPRNYQGAKASLEQRGHLLISKTKKETITIIVHQTLNILYLDNWSDHEIKISRTEQELATKLFNNWCDYIDGEFAYVFREFATDVGDIDLLGITFDDEYHVVEVKRKNVRICDCTQLRRYLEAFEDKPTRGYVAAPAIGAKAKAYLEKHNCRWLEIGFD